MCNISKYTEEKHYRNFAIWAAARAASRGGAGLTIDIWDNAISHHHPFNLGNNANLDEFDCNYCGMTERLRVSVNNNLANGNLICFGRAAKFLAVYYKVMFRHSITEPSPYDNYSHYAHPPIDRILLKNVARRFGSDVSWNQSTRLPTWTMFEREEYMGIVQELRNLLHLLHRDQPLWKIEYYWSPIG